jgi:hypothetical protein
MFSATLTGSPSAIPMAQNLMDTEFETPINWASSHIEVKDDLDEVVLEFPFLEALQVSQQSH